MTLLANSRSSGLLSGGDTLIRAENDISKVVQWKDVSDTAKLILYYKQRVGPGIEKVPSVTVMRRDWLTLLSPPNGSDIYVRMTREDEAAAEEVSFNYDPTDPHKVKFAFHIETPNPGSRFLAFLGKHGHTEFHKLLLQHLMGISRQCHDLHLKWKLGPVPYHRISIPSR